MMFRRMALVAGSVLGLLAVAVGALGAHAWKAALLHAGRLDTFELAVRFQFFHALLLLILGSLAGPSPTGWQKGALAGIVSGTLLFSGSLYFICAWGPISGWWITPLGGISLMMGWACLAGHALTQR